MREQAEGISVETVEIADNLSVAILSEDQLMSAKMYAEDYRQSRIRDADDAYAEACPEQGCRATMPHAYDEHDFGGED